jgi:CAAX protease family protein
MAPSRTLAPMERSTGVVERGRRGKRRYEFIHHPMLAYAVIAYLVSWTLAVPLIVEAVPPSFHLVVASGPAVAALLVTAVVAGREGIRALARRIVGWRAFPSWRWWLVALSPLGFLAVGLMITAIAGQLPESIDWAHGFDDGGWLIGLVGTAVAFGILEEIGWRGFLLPRLQSSHTASRASLILFAVWAGWHLPMFSYHFDFGPALVVGWAVSLYFGTVFLTFLLNSTRGSLVGVILFHISLDLATGLAGAISDVATMTVGALVVVATIAAARWGGSEDLSRYGRFTITDQAPVPAGPAR